MSSNLCTVNECPNRVDGVDIKTSWATIKNIPPYMLMGLVVLAMCAFLMWKITGSFDANLNTMAKESGKQTVLLQRILDKH